MITSTLRRAAVALGVVWLVAFTPSWVEAQVAGHVGTDFWLAYPDSSQGDGAELYIQSNQPATFTVTITTPVFTFTAAVAPGAPQTVSLPALVEIRTNQTIETKGIHVTSDQPISVVFRSPVPPGFADDAYLGLPVPVLGTEYIALAYKETLSGRLISGTVGPSEFVVLATQDGTTVTMTVSCTSFGGTFVGSVFPISLNQGQTYQYKCGFQQDVTGSVITSNKPVAVFAGSSCSDIPLGGGFCDYLVEQMLPVALWGTDYWTVPLNTGTADVLRVLASRDGTVVTIDNGVSPSSFGLNRRQFVEVTMGLGTHITANQPILVAQYARGSQVAPVNNNRDPLMMLIIPTQFFLPSHRLFVPPGYLSNFISIVAPAEAASSVRVDGGTVSGFTALPGGTFSRATVPLAEGEHTVTAAAPIGVYVYGLKLFGSYGYPAGLGNKTVRDLRIVETSSTIGVELDELSFSRPPVSVTPLPGAAVIEWRLPTLSVNQVEDLSFEVVLANPVPGEDRLVSQGLEVLYTGIDGKPARAGLGPQAVHVLLSAFDTAVTTDKAAYSANETVRITFDVINHSDIARTVDVIVEIRDGQGNLVQTIARLPGITFAPGQTQTFTGLTYNTLTTFAGAYPVRVTLLDVNKDVGDATASFTILPVRQATSQLVADKSSYSANEPVTLTATVASQSSNSVLTALNAVVQVTGPSGASIVTEQRSLADELPGARAEFKVFTNTGTLPAGIYSATLQVRSAADLLTTAATSFEILSALDQARALAGSIQVSPSTILQRERTTITYTVQNVSNVVDLPVIQVEILVVDPDTRAPVRIVTDEASLNGREVFIRSIDFGTLGLAAQDYLLVLRGTTAGITQALASTGLRIQAVSDRAPLADAGPDRHGFVGLAVTLDGSASSDPDGDALTFAWHFLTVPSSSQVTNVSLVNAQTATPSFVPDREGTYVLSLVVTDGVLDSPVDTASVFVNSPPTVDVHPETINLKSNGGSQSVTAVLASRVLSSFAFFTASDGLTATAQFTLENRYVDRDGNAVVFTVPAQVPSGGYRVVATDTDGDGHPDLYQLTLKFSRALIIAGFTDAGGNLRITQSTPMVSTVIADGVIVGSDTNSVITPP